MIHRPSIEFDDGPMFFRPHTQAEGIRQYPTTAIVLWLSLIPEACDVRLRAGSRVHLRCPRLDQ